MNMATDFSISGHKSRGKRGLEHLPSNEKNTHEESRHDDSKDISFDVDREGGGEGSRQWKKAKHDKQAQALGSSSIGLELQTAIDKVLSLSMSEHLSTMPLMGEAAANLENAPNVLEEYDCGSSCDVTGYKKLFEMVQNTYKIQINQLVEMMNDEILSAQLLEKNECTQKDHEMNVSVGIDSFNEPSKSEIPTEEQLLSTDEEIVEFRKRVAAAKQEKIQLEKQLRASREASSVMKNSWTKIKSAFAEAFDDDKEPIAGATVKDMKKNMESRVCNAISGQKELQQLTVQSKLLATQLDEVSKELGPDENDTITVDFQDMVKQKVTNSITRNPHSMAKLKEQLSLKNIRDLNAKLQILNDPANSKSHY